MATVFGLIDKALGLAENILTFLNEGKAAGIVAIVKKFFGDISDSDLVK